MVGPQSPSGQTRADVIWQRSSVTDAYHASRTGIPFADAHFDMMHRRLEAAGIPVDTLLDLGAGDGIATDVISRCHPLTSAVLVDFSSPMFEAARDRLTTDHADCEVVAASYYARHDADAKSLAPVQDQLEWLRDVGYADVDCAFRVCELAVFAGRRPPS